MTAQERRPIGATRTIAMLVAGLAVSATAGPALGQNPQIDALYQGSAFKQDFSFTWKEKGDFTKPVGRLRWEVPASQFSTGGMDRSFSGFCAEPLVPIVAGNLYKYEVQSPEMPGNYGLPNTDDGRKEASRRAVYVRELFARYYLASLGETDPVPALAFQAALWEVVNESQFPEVAAPFDLFTGNFRANYPSLEQSPPYVQQAQQYLKSLTGNDTVFYENQNLLGRELVSLKGLMSAGGTVAQSQFGLRDSGAGAGVPGFNGATANGGNGAIGGGLLGGGGGGAGGFGRGGFGGLSPFAGGGGGGGGGGSTGGGTGLTTPGGTGPDGGAPSIGGSPGSPQIPTTPSGPSTTPPDTTGNGPPNQPPDNTNPVPAPAGVVLGFIAVGLFAGRRMVSRIHAKG